MLGRCWTHPAHASMRRSVSKYGDFSAVGKIPATNCNPHEHVMYFLRILRLCIALFLHEFHPGFTLSACVVT